MTAGSLTGLVSLVAFAGLHHCSSSWNPGGSQS
jgi:hypothetical protein